MPKIKLICKTCKKPFKVFPYRITTRNVQFCSIKCSNTVFRKGHISWLKGTKKLISSNKGSFKKGLIPWNKNKKYPQFSGKNHPNWKGGRKIVHGYVYLLKPEHPYATQEGYIKQSRYIMEKHLERYLKSQEIVHHINENISDNRIENLMLFPNKSAHNGFHKQIYWNRIKQHEDK